MAEQMSFPPDGPTNGPTDGRHTPSVRRGRWLSCLTAGALAVVMALGITVASAPASAHDWQRDRGYYDAPPPRYARYGNDHRYDYDHSYPRAWRYPPRPVYYYPPPPPPPRYREPPALFQIVVPFR